MTKTKKSDYPSAEVRYEAALEEVKEKLQTGELFEKSMPFERRVVDIPALRKHYDMTQQQFADAFGIAIGTLRNWEQGRRIPDGPAQRLLEIIEDRPDVAIEVLGSHAVQRGVPSPDEIRERAAEVRRRKLEATAARSRLEMEGPAKDAESGRSGLFAINKLIHRVAGPAPAPGSASSSEPKTEPDEDAGKGQELQPRHGKAG